MLHFWDSNIRSLHKPLVNEKKSHIGSSTGLNIYIFLKLKLFLKTPISQDVIWNKTNVDYHNCIHWLKNASTWNIFWFKSSSSRQFPDIQHTSVTVKAYRAYNVRYGKMCRYICMVRTDWQAGNTVIFSTSIILFLPLFFQQIYVTKTIIPYHILQWVSGDYCIKYIVEILTSFTFRKVGHVTHCSRRSSMSEEDESFQFTRHIDPLMEFTALMSACYWWRTSNIFNV